MPTEGCRGAGVACLCSFMMHTLHLMLTHLNRFEQFLHSFYCLGIVNVLILDVPHSTAEQK